MNDLIKEIRELKEEKKAIILAHNYQRKEIQDIADYTGDSLGLSIQASETDAEIIVFSAVRFMAETASILNPNKKVLLPDKHASCRLAEMCPVQKLMEWRKKHPDFAVVSYVNTFADVKAESDICCTSSNAVDIVKSLTNQNILFTPDKNLASFTAERIQSKNIVPWQGFCYVHQYIDTLKIDFLKHRYPEAEVMVHPECTPEVRRLADFVGSTAQMQKYASDSEAKEYVVGTEDGLTYRLGKDNPKKRFHPVSATCVGMKRNTLHDILNSLKEEKHQIYVPEHTRTKAYNALDKMLKRGDKYYMHTKDCIHS
jgi:quinolinate synthase